MGEEEGKGSIGDKVEKEEKIEKKRKEKEKNGREEEGRDGQGMGRERREEERRTNLRNNYVRSVPASGVNSWETGTSNRMIGINKNIVKKWYKTKLCHGPCFVSTTGSRRY